MRTHRPWPWSALARSASSPGAQGPRGTSTLVKRRVFLAKERAAKGTCVDAVARRPSPCGRSSSQPRRRPIHHALHTPDHAAIRCSSATEAIRAIDNRETPGRGPDVGSQRIAPPNDQIVPAICFGSWPRSRSRQDAPVLAGAKARPCVAASPPNTQDLAWPAPPGQTPRSRTDLGHASFNHLKREAR